MMRFAPLRYLCLVLFYSANLHRFTAINFFRYNYSKDIFQNFHFSGFSKAQKIRANNLTFKRLCSSPQKSHFRPHTYVNRYFSEKSETNKTDHPVLSTTMTQFVPHWKYFGKTCLKEACQMTETVRLLCSASDAPS